jgi:hypothetical protein
MKERAVIIMMITGALLLFRVAKIWRNNQPKPEYNTVEVTKYYQKMLARMDSISNQEGYDFEEFIVKKFNQKYFSIKLWGGVNYQIGDYSENTQKPNLIVEYAYKGYKRLIAIECNWQNEYYEGGIEFSNYKQLESYKKFEQDEQIDVYIALGVGGEDSKPQTLYLMPLKWLKQPFVSRKDLMKYWKNADGKFYLNMKNEVLDISFPPTNESFPAPM